MPMKTSLRIDWATHDAAKYACETWHYSKCLPSGKTVKCGVWEDDKFVGVVIFALGANGEINSMFGPTAELARVALSKHQVPVTKVLSVCLNKLKKLCPKLNAVISYADLDRHEGTIYKAGNWIEQCVVHNPWLRLHGKPIHPRTAFARYGTRSIGWLRANVDPKAEYIKDSKGKKRFVWFYDPVKRAGSKDNVASGFQSEEGGATPIPALQIKKAELLHGGG